MILFVVVIVLIISIVAFQRSSSSPILANHVPSAHLSTLVLREPVFVAIFWLVLASIVYRVLWNERIISSSVYGVLVQPTWGGMLARTWVMFFSIIPLTKVWQAIPAFSSRMYLTLMVVLRWLATLGIAWLWTHDGVLEWAIAALIGYVLWSWTMLAVGNKMLLRVVAAEQHADSPIQTPLVYGAQWNPEQTSTSPVDHDR